MTVILNKPTLWLNITTSLSALFCAGLIAGTFSVLLFSQGLPDAEGIREIELKVPLRVYSSDGLLISEFGSERRIPIDYQDTPKSLVNAVLASEDDNFFNHLGIDFVGLVRAALANFSSGRSGQGASTITMQVARNFYLSPEKTYTRKIKEILLAIRIEQALEKEEILSLYLNKIFLGHRSYGFGAAAETYYGKPLSELNLAQIAMLAGLPKAPSNYNPIRNPERATIRRNYVLGRMKNLDWITSEAHQEAITQPVTAKRHARETGLDAPHIAEMVRAQLTEQYGEDAYWQGLNVYTTIATPQQNAATASLRSGLQAYDKRHGYRGPVTQIDLTKYELTPENESEIYEDILRPYPDSREQTPALVISVDDTQGKGTAELWSREAGFLSLNFRHVKWAKRHITANRVGAPPKQVGDVLSRGDVVYIKPAITESNDPETTNTQDSLSNWQLTQIPAVSGSLISIKPDTGAIISLVGGYDFFLNKYNRATQSIRQAGSNIKPFIYSASLEKGFTPASLISGAPIVLTDPVHGTRWRPENYSGKFFGPTRMRVALSKSMNLVSIRLLRSISIAYAKEYIQRFGLDTSRFSNSLTMALGSGGVKPIEMVSAYAILANGGYRINPYFIERITDRNGTLIYQAQKPEFCDECILDYLPTPEIVASQHTQDPSQIEDEVLTDDSDEALNIKEENSVIEQETKETYSAPRVMTHANNRLTVSMLKDVVNRGTARKAQALKRSDLAGKTGTTNDYVDAWFSGFNSQVVTTVWVGFDQPSTMGRGEAGSLAALPIWVDYMKTGLRDVEQDENALPSYLEQGYVNRNTGTRTDESDSLATPELFVISDLTPETMLLQERMAAAMPNPFDDNEGFNNPELGPELDLEPPRFDEGNPQINDEFDAENSKPELGAQEPAERILETEEDTDGLF